MPSSNVAVNKPAPSVASHPLITATGTRGFLQWLKNDPVLGKVYNSAKSQISQAVAGQPTSPTGMGKLSKRTLKNLRGIYSGSFVNRTLEGLADYGSYASYTSSSSIAASGGTANPLNVISPAATLAPISTDSVTQSASTSATSPSTAATLTQVIAAAGQAALTANQVLTATQISQIQLQRAQAGLSPLNLNAYGLSSAGTISGATSPLLLLLLLGGGVILLASESK
jgi:hypothetical protein